MKIGMTQNISPSFRSSHSTSLGDASPTTVRSASRKVGRLRRADMAANWSDIATRKYSLSGGPPPMCFTSCAVIFQTLAHKAKYAPFGMLGKPKSAVIIKGAHYRLWVSLYLVGGSLTSWAGNPFEPQFPVFLAQRRLEARLPNSTRSSSSKQRNGVVGLAHSLPTSSATHRFMISVAS